MLSRYVPLVRFSVFLVVVFSCSAEAIADQTSAPGADLSGADFSGANLDGAVFTGANMVGAVY
nr:pentapeptide repeat-containing protein [Gammaproteobacteria bacterium]